MKKNNFRIVIAGEGGQGVQSIAHAFTRAAFEAGFNVAYMPNYGVEQRGGVSLGFLQFGKEPIGFPKFAKADILVIMCERAVQRTEIYLSEETLCIYDSGLISGHKLSYIHAQKLPIPASSIATEKLEPKVFNMILAGAILAEVGILKKEFVEKALDEIFKDKYQLKPQLKSLNKRALELGQTLAIEAYAK